LVGNLAGGLPCGFLNVNRKLRPLSSAFQQLFPWPFWRFHRREPAKHVPVGVQDDHQRVPVPVASDVELGGGESVAAAAPEQREGLPREVAQNRGSMETITDLKPLGTWKRSCSARAAPPGPGDPAGHA
jgi:hypothetical protein